MTKLQPEKEFPQGESIDEQEQWLAEQKKASDQAKPHDDLGIRELNSRTRKTLREDDPF